MALAAWMSAVSTNCPPGPREFLGAGMCGRLCPVGDAKLLAAAMDESLASGHDEAAPIERSKDFSIQNAVDQCERLLVRQ